MIEIAVKTFFLVGFLLLGAMLVRRELFLDPSVGSDKLGRQQSNHRKVPDDQVSRSSNPAYLDLREITNIWNVSTGIVVEICK